MKLNEDTRTQLTSKSRNADNYKNPVRGKNRWERKKYSKVATQVKSYNNINMNDFFKKDLLTINIPVTGETNDYTVTFQLDGVMSELARNVKSNKNIFEYRSVVQALTKVFNTADIKVKCTCNDFKYRYQHQLIINNNNVDGTDKDPGPGRTGMANTSGKGCKHVLLALANLDWVMKVASCIKNYISYMDENKHQLFIKVIFPKLYGITADEAIENGIVPEDTDLETDKNTIETINDWAKNRGKMKPGTNINPAAGKGKIKNDTEKENKEEN